MKPAYGLELVQTQKLVLTPELHQAIMILQMNVREPSGLILRKSEEPSPGIAEETTESNVTTRMKRIDGIFL